MDVINRLKQRIHKILKLALIPKGMRYGNLSFEELLDEPQVFEYSRIAGRLGIMAVHGGKIEPGTEEIACQVAFETGSSLYVISPRGEKEGSFYHVTSSRIDPRKSSALETFIRHVDIGISIHGYWEDWDAIFLGGRNQDVKRIVAAELARSFPNYGIVTNLDRIPRYMRGSKKENIINRPNFYGVQVELPPYMRQETARHIVVEALAESVRVASRNRLAKIAEEGSLQIVQF